MDREKRKDNWTQVLEYAPYFVRGDNIRIPNGGRWNLRKVLRVQGNTSTLTMSNLDIVDWIEHFYYKFTYLVTKYFMLFRKIK